MIQCVMDTLGMGEGSERKKSWEEMKLTVASLRRQLSCLSLSIPTSVNFSQSSQWTPKSLLPECAKQRLGADIALC